MPVGQECFGEVQVNEFFETHRLALMTARNFVDFEDVKLGVKID